MPSARRLFTIGIVILAVAVVLLFIVSPYALESTFSNSLKQAQKQINSSTYLLAPNQSISISISQGKLLIYNSSNPLKVLINGQNVSQAGSNNIWIAASTTNGTITIANNYTVPIRIGYAIVGIVLWPSYLSIFLSIILGIVGVVIIAYGTIISIRNKSKLMK
ncbi:hypothetical protein [Caldisphaera sp.]|uniref:hypothetical protein n=1 Tax=Caldisphaera sp. TaxID=2060322 RepID=UPI0025C6888F|nr:hypothetical protein [Caldisphaera sp.]